MADPLYITRAYEYESPTNVYQSPTFNRSSTMWPNIRNMRILIGNNLRGQQTDDPFVLAEKMLSVNCPLASRYEVIDLVGILCKNIYKKENQFFQSIITALGILEKYARNLLKPPAARPPKWKIIFFTNWIFKTKVGVVEGSKEILQQLGYSSPITDGLSFPDDVNEPDQEHVRKIVTDLIIANVELDRYVKKLHPHPDVVLQALRGTRSVRASSDGNGELYGPASGLNTPSSYNATMPTQVIYETPTQHSMRQSQFQSQTKSPTPSQTQNLYSPPSSVIVAAHAEERDTCQLCGELKSTVYCRDCKNSNCIECDQVWHSHPKRKGHRTEPLPSNRQTALKMPPQGKHTIQPPSQSFYEDVFIQASAKQCTPMDVPQQALKTPIPTSRNYEIARSGSVLPVFPTQGGNVIQSGSSDNSSDDTSTISDKIKIIWKESIQLLERVENIQNRLAVIDRNDPLHKGTEQEFEVLEKERRTLMSRHTNLMKRKDALDLVSRAAYKGKSGVKPTLSTERPTGRSTDEGTSFQELPYIIKKPPVDDFVIVESPTSLSTTKVRSLAGSQQGLQHIDQMNQQDFKTQIAHHDGRRVPNRLDESSSTSYGRVSPSTRDKQQVPNQYTKMLVPPMVYIPPEIAALVESPVKEPHAPQHLIGISPEYTVLTHVETEGNSARTKSPPSTSALPSPGDAVSHQIPGWECQYCTYWNNDTSICICDVCSKTTYLNTQLTEVVKAPAAVVQPAAHIANERQTSASCQSDLSISMQEEEEEMLQLKRKAKHEDDLQTSLTPVRRNLVGSKMATTLPQMPHGTKCNDTTRKESATLPSVLSLSRSRMTLEDMVMKTRQEKLRTHGQMLVTSIRNAESDGFNFDAIELAAHESQKCGVAFDDWIQNHYHDHLHAVKKLVNKKLDDIVRGATVSDALVIDALNRHSGDIKKVEEECIIDVKLKLKELMKLKRDGHVLTMEEIAKELAKYKGDITQTMEEIQKECMSKFYDRIWETGPNMKEKFIDYSSEDEERKLMLLFAEYNFLSWGRAENALKLINEKKQEIAADPLYYDDVIQAARDYQYLEEARLFFNKECVMCFTDFPMSRLETLPYCPKEKQCLLCMECINGHFKVCISDRNIIHASCPSCNLPDLLNVGEKEVSQYFTMIDTMLRKILEKDIYDLFQLKLLERTLFQSPQFRWCAHCRNGFINEIPDRRKMQCPDCKQFTCFECKKKWEPQHDNITCDEFEQWRKDNNPDSQAAGLALHLQENGIDCPNCKMRFDLAKGGCMHFICTQCKYEFCCSCREKLSNNCTKYDTCRSKGLHAHHPRDCLFYLRDYTVEILQNLLKNHTVAFDTKPKHGNQVVNCSVQEQKETPDGLVDKMCGKEVQATHAGLCQVHYKEYLVGLINGKRIDPAEIFDIDELTICIQRHQKHPPARQRQESEEAYKLRILAFLQRGFPIPSKK